MHERQRKHPFPWTMSQHSATYLSRFCQGSLSPDTNYHSKHARPPKYNKIKASAHSLGVSDKQQCSYKADFELITKVLKDSPIKRAS